MSTAPSGAATTYPRYVGRVGALAAALGIGMALATPGVAWATGGDTGSTSTGDGNSASTNTGASTSTSSESSPPTPPSSTVAGSTATSGTQNPTIAGTQSPSATTITRNSGPRVTVRSPGGDVGGPTAPRLLPPIAPPVKVAHQHQRPQLGSSSSGTAEVAPRPARTVSAPLQAPQLLRAPVSIAALSAPQTAAFGVPAAAATSVTPESAPSTPAAPKPIRALLAAPATFVSVAVSKLAAFLGPIVGPGAPTDSPLLWGLLAWTRRQFDPSVATVAAESRTAAAVTNSAPVANNDAFAGKEDKVLRGNVLRNDTDSDRDRRTAILVAGPAHGVVTLNSNGSFTYKPNVNYNGTDGFTYTASDGSALSNTATVTLSLAPVDDLLFKFTYGTGSEYWTPEAKAALQAAADQLSEYIATPSPVTMTYDVTGEYNPSAGYLARGGMAFGIPTRPAGFSNPFIKKVTSARHVDANRRAADGVLLVNFSYTYSYDDSPAPTQFDFESVVEHELLHSMGFQDSLYGNVTTRTTWLTFDKFVVDQSGAPVIGSRYRFDPAYTANLSGANGGLYFGGANAVAAYGGPVPLQTYSLSHLRSSAFPYELMNPTMPYGTIALRNLSPIELGILKDLGYTVVSSPQTLFQSVLAGSAENLVAV